MASVIPESTAARAAAFDRQQALEESEHRKVLEETERLQQRIYGPARTTRKNMKSMQRKFAVEVYFERACGKLSEIKSRINLLSLRFSEFALKVSQVFQESIIRLCLSIKNGAVSIARAISHMPESFEIAIRTKIDDFNQRRYLRHLAAYEEECKRAVLHNKRIITEGTNDLHHSLIDFRQNDPVAAAAFAAELEQIGGDPELLRQARILRG